MTMNKFSTGISISKEEKEIVDSFKKSTGVSFSSTLGLIIREWAQMKKERMQVLSNCLDKDNPYWLTEAGIEQSR